MGFEGCIGVSKEDRVWIFFFFCKENSFCKGMEAGNSDIFRNL